MADYKLVYHKKEGPVVRKKEFVFSTGEPSCVMGLARDHAQNLSHAEGVGRDFELLYPSGHVIPISIKATMVAN